MNQSSTLGAVLRNPLVVFGLILLAGDGPLVVAYSVTKDCPRAWVLLAAMILFIFGMGAVFSYLVIYRPRNLFAPNEIPESAFGKSIYAEVNQEQRENQILRARLKCRDRYMQDLPQWIQDNEKKGKYVAIADGEVIGFDDDIVKIYDMLRANGGLETGFIEKIREIQGPAIVRYYYQYNEFSLGGPGVPPSIPVNMIFSPKGSMSTWSRNCRVVDMVIDTGSSVSVVSPELLKGIELIPSMPMPLLFVSPYGDAYMAQTAYVWIELASMPGNIPGSFGPIQIMIAELRSVTALLGWNFLKDFVLEIDGPKTSIAFRRNEAYHSRENVD